MSVIEYNQEKTDSLRTELWKCLPLSKPYSVVFSLANVCNFKCFFCLQSKIEILPACVENSKYMDFEVFKKCIDNILKLGKLKKINLSGIGEPLTNPDVVKFVDYAMKSKVAEEIELITNASLLTKEMADGLISAGLDKLKVSIYGLSDEEYLDISKAKINFSRIVNNIKYFYEHKDATKIRIKIMDSMVDTKEKMEKFRAIFMPICDEMVIENIKPIYKEVDYSRLSEATTGKNFYNEELIENEICSRPFFNVSIWTDGSVGQCSNVLTLNDIQFGNAAEDFAAIWNGKKYNEFLLELLKQENFHKYSVCSECVEYRCMALPNDILDGHEEELIKRYEAKIRGILE